MKKVLSSLFLFAFIIVFSNVSMVYVSTSNTKTIKTPSSVLSDYAKKMEQKEKAQNHSNQRIILGFPMPPTGVEPVLCLQKGILSPSCLPVFGKVDFRSFYRSISHCERDFFSASERDSHFLTR